MKQKTPLHSRVVQPFLQALASGEALAFAPEEDTQTYPGGRIKTRLVHALLERHYIERTGDHLNLVAAGRAYLRQRVARVLSPAAAACAPLHKAEESPLAFLHARRGKDGDTLISDVQFAAGEKLRADFTRAQLHPRVTSSWNFDGGTRSCRGYLTDFADHSYAARERVKRALRAVGPDLSGLLVDVCCFLKGLTHVESERGWPARSARLVLGLALNGLARHYGLAPQAKGAERLPIQMWGHADYRAPFPI